MNATTCVAFDGAPIHNSSLPEDQMSEEEQDPTVYAVVVNHEEQYSIWRVGRPVPLGWREVGHVGTKASCLEYIEEHWTDMRPLSVRRAMDGAASDG